MSDTTEVPTIALNALKASLDAQQDVARGTPSAWDLEPEDLDTSINLATVPSVRDLMNTAALNTPTFLNGILLDHATYRRIVRLLDGAQRDLILGARQEHSLNTSFRASGAGMSGFLKSLLKE